MVLVQINEIAAGLLRKRMLLSWQVVPLAIFDIEGPQDAGL